MNERVSDPSDRASQLEEAEREAMAKVKRPTLERIGRCHFCSEPLAPPALFCDADCMSGYSRLQKHLEIVGKRRT